MLGHLANRYTLKLPSNFMLRRVHCTKSGQALLCAETGQVSQQKDDRSVDRTNLHGHKAEAINLQLAGSPITQLPYPLRHAPVARWPCETAWSVSGSRIWSLVTREETACAEMQLESGLALRQSK